MEGEYEWAIDDDKPKIFKAGDTFYEATRLARHRQESEQEGQDALHRHRPAPGGRKDVVIPEKHKE